jgi:2-dehydropantoate 2-reductase
MRFCIIGAGAIGGYLAAKLSKVADVTVIARGETLRVLQTKGLTLIERDQTTTIPIQVEEHIEQAGKYDAVILAVKGHQIAQISDKLESLCEEDTALITVQNGIPWWYFQRREQKEFENYVIRAADPDGILTKTIDPKRIIGCIVYPATKQISPGVIQHEEGNRFPLGELDGVETERIKHISKLWNDAGLRSPILTDIRGEVWLKEWGSACFNPVSALTHGSLGHMCTSTLAVPMLEQIMQECSTIATRLGITLRVPIERRINGAASMGDHKTSMLHDVEDGRETEIDSLVGTVIELGKLTNIPTPRLETLYVCVKLLSEVLAKNKAKVVTVPVDS